MTASDDFNQATVTSSPSDPIQRPPHYTFSAIEPIAAIEAWQLGFHLGNVVKYVARARRKGRELEDLKKARWYLERAIGRLESQPATGRSSASPCAASVTE